MSISNDIRYIEQQYGHRVTLDAKPFTKFGENPSVGTAEATIMEFLGSEVSETFATGNTIDKLVTDDAGFTGDVYVEGHTLVGGNKVFMSQTLTMTGQTAATLSTPLHRITRLQNVSGSNLASAKKIYGFESSGVTVTSGVPQTNSAVHIILSAAEEQSLKAATSVSGTQYFICTNIDGAMNKKTQGGAVIRFKVRESSSVFQTKYKRGVNSLGPDLDKSFAIPLIITPNSDIVMTAEADSSAPVQSSFSGYFATIQ
jgi:hypothetical protein